jgi:hypothetical protein
MNIAPTRVPSSSIDVMDTPRDLPNRAGQL